MPLQSFRARADYVLTKGAVYTLDTLTGEVYAMTKMASPVEAIQPPAPAVAAPTVVLQPAPPPALSEETAGKRTRHHVPFVDRVRLRNKLLLAIWEGPGLVAAAYQALVPEYKEFYEAVNAAVRSDLDRFEKNGLVLGKRTQVAMCRAAPTGIQVTWDVTEAGNIEARRIRAGQSETDARTPADETRRPFLRVLP